MPSSLRCFQRGGGGGCCCWWSGQSLSFGLVLPEVAAAALASPCPHPLSARLPRSPTPSLCPQAGCSGSPFGSPWHGFYMLDTAWASPLTVCGESRALGAGSGSPPPLLSSPACFWPPREEVCFLTEIQWAEADLMRLRSPAKQNPSLQQLGYVRITESGQPLEFNFLFGVITLHIISGASYTLSKWSVSSFYIS